MKKILLISLMIFCLTSCKRDEPIAELPQIEIPPVQEVINNELSQNPDELEIDLSIEEENDDVSIDD